MKNLFRIIFSAFIMGIGFLCIQTPLFASTVTYTTSNMSLDTNAALNGLSNLRTANSKIYLNWNRPAVDSNHIGYWKFDDGSGTSAADASSNANSVNTFNSGVSWDTSSTFAYAGNGAVFFPQNHSDKISFGNILDYEYTQPWTAMAAIKMYAKPATASIIFTNVNNDGNYPGHEFWVDNTGVLRVRLIHAISNSYIGVTGTTNVADGNWHYVAATYDGSGTAAGVKMYIDGVAETTSVESDTLGGQSIIGVGNDYTVGNQLGFESSYYMRGWIDEFTMYNVAKNSSFFSTYHTASTLAPCDSSCVMNLHFDETQGNTVYDSSTNAFSTTVTENGMLTGNRGLGSNALFFDNPSSGATAPHISAYNLGSQFTITGWGYDFGPNMGTLLYHASASSPFPGWGFYSNNGNQDMWWWPGSGGGAFIDSGVLQPTGWHQLGIRYNSGTLDFFIDGSKVATKTSIAQPDAANTSLVFGNWTTNWYGYMSLITISNTNRSDSYMTQFGTWYPSSGVASLSSPSTSVTSGGGDLGQDSTVTNLSATFDKPGTTNLQYRIGLGDTAAAATADKQAASYTTLSASNTLSKTGRFVDFDIKMSPSTDSLASLTPDLTNVTLTYSANPTPTPTPTPGSSGSSSPSSSSNPTPPSCSDSKPTSTPHLFQINTTNTTATMYFSPAQNATYHYIAFGYKAGDQRFGTSISQGTTKGAIKYTVHYLSPNTTYYFQVRGGNGCRPGDWSNVLHAKTTSSSFLTWIITAWQQIRDTVLSWI